MADRVIELLVSEAGSGAGASFGRHVLLDGEVVAANLSLTPGQSQNHVNFEFIYDSSARAFSRRQVCGERGAGGLHAERALRALSPAILIATPAMTLSPRSFISASNSPARYQRACGSCGVLDQLAVFGCWVNFLRGRFCCHPAVHPFRARYGDHFGLEHSGRYAVGQCRWSNANGIE
jgi:hypothetical protein